MVVRGQRGLTTGPSGCAARQAVKESWFARLYDPAIAPLEPLGLARARADVVAAASGFVLEVGAGTGRNLPYYRAATRVVVSDPDPAMLRRARRRATAAQVPNSLIVTDAQALPFADRSFDTVVGTCVFCSVADPVAAFREIRRVLKPEGELRMLEHVRAPAPWAASLQDRVTPAWQRIAHGCHLNRETLRLVEEAGFRPTLVVPSLGGVVVRAVFAARPAD